MILVIFLYVLAADFSNYFQSVILSQLFSVVVVLIFCSVLFVRVFKHVVQTMLKQEEEKINYMKLLHCRRERERKKERERERKIENNVVVVYFGCCLFWLLLLLAL